MPDNRQSKRKQDRKREKRETKIEKMKKNEDTRRARITANSIVSGVQQPAIEITVPVLPAVFACAALDFIAYALTRGYTAFASAPDNPYLSWVYLTNVFISYAQNSPPQGGTMPLWIQEMGQAFAPKIVPFQNGKIAYRFDVQGPVPYIPQSNFDLSPLPYSYQWLLWKPNPTGQVDMFPTAQPAVYSSAAAEGAWAELLNFIACWGEDSRMKNVAISLQQYWSKCVSTFAMPMIVEGFGGAGAGGYVYQSGLEVPVHVPHIGCLANQTTVGSTNATRYPIFSAISAGDPVFAGAWMSRLTTPDHRFTKRHTRFHFVDFTEFQDVVAQWATALIQNLFDDPVSAATISQPQLYQCPLSLQEMGLLLRNEIMVLFSDTQTAVQGIYPATPQSSTDNVFTPFIAGTTTAPITTAGMKLPLPLVENLKSLVSRFVLIKKPGGKEKEQLFCPVLGKYANDNLVSSDYFSLFPGDPSPFPTFTTLAASLKVNLRGSKGADNWVSAGAEIPIDFVDGASGSSYVYINDTTRLADLASLWNNWLVKLSNYSSQLTTISKDLGVNICVSVAMTRHWVNQSSNARARLEGVRDSRLEGRSVGSVYIERQAVAISSRDVVLSAPFDAILSTWILPINYSNVGQSPESETFFSRVQIMAGEPYSVSQATVDSGKSMASLHSTYASKMVHSRDAPAGEWDAFFTEQQAKGTGGILSSLAASFIGSAFGPGAGSVANTIAEIIPF